MWVAVLALSITCAPHAASRVIGIHAEPPEVAADAAAPPADPPSHHDAPTTARPTTTGEAPPVDDDRLERMARFALAAGLGSVAGVAAGTALAYVAATTPWPGALLPTSVGLPVLGALAFALGVAPILGGTLVAAALALDGPVPWLPITLAASAGAVGAVSALFGGVALWTYVYFPIASRTTDCVCGIEIPAFIVGTGVAMAGAAASVAASTMIVATALEPPGSE